MTTPLRTGRTTGTCATAAAMAGTVFLLTGARPATFMVPLPPGGHLEVPVARYEHEGDAVRVTVVKDGGDDPDATHGCDIQAVVEINQNDTDIMVVLVEGGIGVGVATLPGLPVAVGQPAINPEPRRQIEAGVRHAAGPDFAGRVRVVVEVPDGERLAAKTMNPRLGIVGGISILGTQGIVKPYSHDSWKATVAEGLDVARALGLEHAVFTTGRRTERLYLDAFPHTPETAMIQAADFFEFSMDGAAQRGFIRVTWSLFFGKLVKQAQGLAYTHAKSHPVDFARLAELCVKAGCAPGLLPAIREANTARQVLDLLRADPALPALLALLTARAASAARAFSGGRCAVSYAVFDFDGQRLI
ncbi:MAG: cobalt-precorrin-5B (C(1))-methyltransferase CbiD [Pseudodesulfovibrio sp.]|uniref:Cobalt-precorrin-5B C(1)-methyltransferase n=1 Tax=Pseudodesulfovibrio aespoeensis (strain ATCC 700646 / DSM 10631 / Aspo-2) TaxID=643562 RepID=E6VQN8_PSEA9|nr:MULTISPECIES: cobalt-precorrin-5B (C(1))-methyltransferase CbiD [Pseudodesulfovibrio]MBU4192083.1 cobalt-precorrin-5B (C(1))-methyltransferase CbiD [Pseudomonadota bacterium]ADU61765.1 cobalamin biosynthesis protein CbiD [Pseudodesulfovibrio aespoeensis Aspo-2]MBU4243038.1 cobalt-precorrin-5B (C(1))-methyltransferase CbiD [Pseudomonadota bacterium]MBU4378271.1 cobalt-precorrin-5B (C(1))-methyltransferase CbiD [Pseudomonadota bacterium]MBU4475825.1 cobalt-precorrin-5B (C(1))-methyltransferas